MKMLALLLFGLIVEGRFFNNFISIQQRNEVYTSYIPYFSTCDYKDNDKIDQGAVKMIEIDDERVFDEIKHAGQIIFWLPVKNGMNLLLMQKELTGAYDGLILYDSTLNDQLNRQFILYNWQPANTSLEFSYMLGSIDVSTLTTSTISLQDTTLTFDDIQNITNCSEVDVNYLGSDHFVWVCMESGESFTFMYSPQSNETTPNITFYNLITEGLQPNFVASAPNPSNLQPLPPTFQQGFSWNLLLLSESPSTNQSTTYFLYYNTATQSLTYSSFKQLQLLFTTIIDRIWGSQQFFQQIQLQQFITKLSENKQLYFPGSIISVFVNEHNNMYVQSRQNKTTYLNIFDGKDQLQIANITYSGEIAYYNSDEIYVYEKQDCNYFRIQIKRPIFTIYADNQTANQLTYMEITIPCNGMDDLVINYTILWAPWQYPTAYIYQLNTSPLYTTTNIYAFDLMAKYLVIGPAFNVYVSSSPDIQATIIDSSIINLDSSMDTVLQIRMIEDLFSIIYHIVYSSEGKIILHNTRSSTHVNMVQHPCGFQIVQDGRKVQSGYVLEDGSDMYCLCDDGFSNCKLISRVEYGLEVMAAHRPYSHLFLSYLGQVREPTVTIRKNLFHFYPEGFLISILTNNTVMMMNLTSNTTIAKVEMNCTGENQTNGDIFTRQFHSPLLLLYCSGDSSITEYVIREMQFVFERIIPMYGFKTRSQNTNFLIGINFAYISVDPIISMYPVNKECCVLRLDPTENTVSVLQEIILTKNILKVLSKEQVDIALYTNQAGNNFLKVYLSTIYVALNGTNKSVAVSEEQIEIIFLSHEYNFAAIFKETITFNYTSYQIRQKGATTTEIQLVEEANQFGTPIFRADIQYDFHDICGPVFETLFLKNTSNESFFEVTEGAIVTANKILGKIGQSFLEIIEPSDYGVQDLTLNDLMLVVAEQTMYIYVKLLDDVQMQYIGQITLPQSSCTYYIYDIINQTTAQFSPNCQSPNYRYMNPFLTLSYINGIVISEFDSVFMPISLHNIYTIIIKGQPTLMVGVAQGPMKAKTGKLYLCSNFLCDVLYESSTDLFLINYDVYINGRFYMVMSLDVEEISVFLSPTVEHLSEPIQSNYTFEYGSIVKEKYCSTLLILGANETGSKIILSCSQAYYQLEIVFATAQINISRRFNRYQGCSPYDEFRPDAFIDDNSDIEVMLTVCIQNLPTLKLQSYQTINSTLPVIYTGYLQVFTLKGPMCSSSIFDAIKIIPLSSSMSNPLFQLYSVNGNMKLIYSQINGILVDNYLAVQPTLCVSYTPLTTIMKFPSLVRTVKNPYSTCVENVQTTSAESHPILVVNYISFGFYAFLNILTLIFLICFCVKEESRKTKKGRDSNFTNHGQDLQYDDTLRTMGERGKLEGQSRRETMRSYKPSQIELFFIKR